MAACAAEARRRGADALWLAVWQQAARPLAFYRRQGFAIVGTTTFAFGDRVDADYVMARSLAASPLAERAERAERAPAGA
jgi:tRNA (guanine37-N1)-methyltransferase